MAMFASHLSAVDKADESQVEPVSSHSTGTCLSTSTSHSLISPKSWIIDSGASKHICSSIEDFMSIRTIRDYVVMLPDHTQIVVNLCDVKLNTHLILKDVLFVPAFKFNLFSVSSFIGSSQLTVSFYNALHHSGSSYQDNDWQG